MRHRKLLIETNFMNVKRNLLIGFGLSLLLLIISSVASFISIRKLLDSQKLVNQTNEVISKLETVLSHLKDAETTQRGFLLTNETNFLTPYKAASSKVFSTLDEVEELLPQTGEQPKQLALLWEMAVERIVVLDKVIQQKQNGLPLSLEDIKKGKLLMDEVRARITSIEEVEQMQLASRTERLNRFAALTPVFIIVASLLAIFVTIISFLQVTNDLKKRTKLQQELEKKDEEIGKRIIAIESIAAQISSGNFDNRISDEKKDSLGSLGLSLNNMASALQKSFTELGEREWLQTGVAALNEKMIGEKDLQQLTYRVLEFLTHYTTSQVGVFYLASGQNTLALSAGIAINKNSLKQELALGEGLAGQSALEGNALVLEDVNEAELNIDFTAGSVKPRSVIAIPIFHEKTLKGVIELASLQPYTPALRAFLKEAVFAIGTAIHSVKDHLRLQALLAETQAQSEELQAQHAEMENINAELEMQAEKLQASEEELRVQQEELQQSNQELEERSHLLEEKNEIILARNLNIQQKADELELSTKYKSEFLANMSHELRTPLNSILLLSRLLSDNHDSNLSKDQIEYASVIQSSGKGLLTLIDEILDLSKIESGKMEIDYSPVTIKEMADEISSLFLPVAQKKELQFTINIKKNTPETIETDRQKVEQILRNLISNALKFTKKGSVTLTIKKASEAVLFTVSDTGIGIPKDKQHTIFEAFQQADGSTRRYFGGTGLGLSISRQLSKLLGGEIMVKSEEEKGSEFSLVLPLQRNTVPQQPAVVESLPNDHPETEEMKKTEPSSFFKDQKFSTNVIPLSVPDDRESIIKGDRVILIVEDDTAFARSLLEYTRKNGYKGIVAVRGDEGIFLAKQFLPIGILLDVQLPVKNGWEVMDELKKDKTTRPIPVHMMSSYEVKNKSISQGAVDFINKPVAFEKLGQMFEKIEQALSRHPGKVLIVEENAKHAQALAYYLQSFNVASEVKSSVEDGIKALHTVQVDCVILDMGVPAQKSYDTLEEVKKTAGLENLPIIVFTGTNLSPAEEAKIKTYADTIVVKTAHSYQRILDEVSLFLHLVEEGKKDEKSFKYKRLGDLSEVLQGKIILVADDDVRNIFSLTKSLENYGVSVLSATDGKEALKQLEEGAKIDLVLMDMMMPEMDGYESTRRIRENTKFRHLPIIAVTAKAMTGDREKCIEAGASDYITKPVDVDQLLSLLRVWLYKGNSM